MSHLLNKKLLIVDDEELLLEALRSELGMQGYQVSTCNNGEAAFALCRQEEFDLVLTDVRMAGWSGLQFLEAIRTQLNYQPAVIMMSGYTDIPLSRMYHSGVDCVLPKPMHADLLLESIERVLIPISQRYWRDPGSREDLLFSAPAAVQGMSVQLGVGGCFVPERSLTQYEECTVGTFLPFALNVYLGSTSFEVKGSGQVVWTRWGGSQAHSGLGLLYCYLGKNRERFLMFLEQLDVVARIPLGEKADG